MKKLDKPTVAAIAAAASHLESFLSEAQDYYDGRSEKWRDSDAGTAYAAWLENMGQLIDQLNEFPEEPEQA